MVIIGSMINTPTRSKFKRLLVKASALGALALVVSSCYLPAHFDTEIELDRAGYYNIKFDGYLADVGLFRGLRDGTISRAQETEKIGVIERDFLRDANTKAFEYFREGHFKLNWERNGDLIEARTVTFIRRNEQIFQLKYMEKSGHVVFEGKSIAKQNRQRILDMGLDMKGQIRLKTDMPIKSDNATSKKKDPNNPRFTWLVWDVANVMSPFPRAVFIIE